MAETKKRATRRPTQAERRRTVRAIAARYGMIGLRVGDLRTMVALLMFTNLHTKRRCLAAMKRLESP